MNKTRKVATASFLCVIMAATWGHAFETHRQSRILSLNILSLNVIARNIAAGVYDNLATHPWLAMSAAGAAASAASISATDRAQIILGSIAEDFDLGANIVPQQRSTHPGYTEIPGEDTVLVTYGFYDPPLTPNDFIHSTRAQNHFYSGGYDPLHPSGIDGRLTDTTGLLVNAMFDFYSDRESALYWALNSSINGANLARIDAQTTRLAKMRILGHLLHLLQDMGVPEHVRDDTHAPSKRPSVYEETLGAMTFQEHETWAGGMPAITPVSLPDDRSYFEELSSFTRTNFFSYDTIFSTRSGMSLDGKITSYRQIVDGTYYVMGSIDQAPVRLAHYNMRGILLHNDVLVTLGGYKILNLPGVPWPTSYWQAAAEADSFSLDDPGIVEDYWRVMKPRILGYCAGFIDRFYSTRVSASPMYWAKTYGGSGADGYFGPAIRQTPDGGYIVAASTYSNSNDILVFKLNYDGSVVWQKAYGGYNCDVAYGIENANDGGYIVVGDSASFAPSYPYTMDIWVLKLFNDGNVEWQKVIGYGDNSGGASSIQQCIDNGYIIAGMAPGVGPRVIKLSANGDIQWKKIYDIGCQYPAGNRPVIRRTSDGGYVVVLAIDLYGRFSVLKLNQAGDVTWAKTYDPPPDGRGTYSSLSYSIQQASDMGYVLTGSYIVASSTSTSNRYFFAKLDSSGNIKWAKAYSDIGNGWHSNVWVTSDQGFIVAISYSYPSGTFNYWILKFDVNGNVEWQKTYGGGNQDLPSSIQQTLDGGYIIAGRTDSFGAGWYDIWIVKIPQDGIMLFNSTSNAFARDTNVIPSDISIVSSNVNVTVTNSNTTAINTNAILGDVQLTVTTQAP